MDEMLFSVPLPFRSFLFFFLLVAVFSRPKAHPVFSELKKSDHEQIHSSNLVLWSYSVCFWPCSSGFGVLFLGLKDVLYLVS